MAALLSKDEAGARAGDFHSLSQRTPFERYLPYLAYQEDEDNYVVYGDPKKKKDAIGYLWECSPLTFATSTSLDTLAGLLRQEYSADTVIQFILFPDENLEPIFENYKALKRRNNKMSKLASSRYVDHLREGLKGFPQMRGIRTRNFRLFVAAYSVEDLGQERIARIQESLTQAFLQPRRLKAGPLMEWLRRVFCDKLPENPQAYTHATNLRRQIIQPECPVIPLENGTLIVGGRHCAVLTPKVLPSYADALDMNGLIGGFMGVMDDGSQVTNRFIWTASIFFKVSKANLQADANKFYFQRAGGTLAKSLGRRVQEYNWVLDDVERQPYVNIISSFCVFGDTEEELNAGVSRVRTLWEGKDFVMQREAFKLMAQSMFIASLPFGLYIHGGNDKQLDRDFKVSVGAAARFLPLQGDYAGRMNPILLFVGRKGQLISMDVFSQGANNYNFLVCAESGAGKSFVTNFIVNNYYTAGAFIRCTDLGDSYKKQCLSQGGRYIDVGDPRNKLVLNPFMSAGKVDEEDKASIRKSCADIILLMAHSNSGVLNLSETHNSLAKDAVNFAIQRDGGVQGMDHVYDFLRNFKKHSGGDYFESAGAIALEMAFNIREFCTGGSYGEIFNGPASFDISQDQFVVLELDRIYSNRSLFNVVSMQVINAITQDLYQSDRSTQRFMLFDEAWKYFSDSPVIAGIINEGYRRARKYNGSTGIVTQSLLDLPKFGPAGDIIKANSAFKFLLQSSQYKEATEAGIVDYSEFELEIAKSIKNNSPNYSEILFETPFGAGVGRLCVDLYTYWVNTSSPGDRAQFERELEVDGDAVAALDRCVQATLARRAAR